MEVPRQQMTAVFQCPLCAEYRAPTYQLLLPHIRMVHSCQPGFHISCGLHGCQRTFKSMKTFTNHVYGYHMISHPNSFLEESGSVESPSGETEDPACGSDSESDDQPDSEFCQYNDQASTSHFSQLPLHSQFEILSKELQSRAAIWILKTKEGHKLTQKAMDDIIQDVTAFSQFLLDKIGCAVKATLADVGVDSNQIQQFVEIFDPDGPFGRPFRGLETAYQQIQYFKTNMGLVEPQPVVLGSERVWKGVGEKRTYKTVNETMMYVPLLETLSSMLDDETIMAEVEKGHSSSSNHLEDFCDGQMYRHHPLYQQHSDALQINLYYDDVEVCNPLGSKRKIHKLGFFYFLLGNLPVHMRSKLSSIQTVIIVKREYITKYSMEAILRPLIEDLKKLEAGCTITLRSAATKVIYGTISTVSADNPASSLLGGFKESGSATRYCRHCTTVKEHIREKVLEDQCNLRDSDTHDKQCSELEEDPSKSVEFGINTRSVLNELQYFHVASGALVPDIMHDLLEGAMPYESKLILKRFIQEDRLFQLSDLNYIIQNFEFGYTEVSNRPTPIEHTTLTSNDNSLKQNASQSWLLSRYLPLMIGAMVPEDDVYWANYTLLVRIMAYLFSPKIDEDDVAVLQEMIMIHHQEFVTLYPACSITPKLHYLIHMPRLICQFGPLIHHWTMRFEAKHKYFKQLANSIGNFINLSFTLSMRHQLFQCYNRLESSDPTLPEVGKGVNMSSSDVPHVQALLRESSGSQVYSPNWVGVHGVKYRKKCVMVLEPAVPEIDKEPLFGQVEEVYVVDSIHVYFYVNVFNTLEYNKHFCTYVVKPTTNQKMYHISHCQSYLPLSAHKLSSFPGCYCVVPKFLLK